MPFKDWLAALLQERDWTVADAAAALGIDQSMVSRYLNGRIAPSRKTLRRIAAATGTPVAELDEMLAAQDRANETRQGVPADVNAFGMPRGFGDMVWDRLSPAARERIIESVRIEVEEAIGRGEL